MEHALWIGGPPRAGKTTVARRFARRHGLRWCSADAHTWEHRDRALAAGHEGALRWEELRHGRGAWPDDPADLLPLTLDLERWQMIAADVARLPSAPLVVVEGTTVTPHLVAEGVADATRAVWLLPTRELHATRLADTPGPAPYWAFLAGEIERAADAAGVDVIHVDESTTVEETLDVLERHFAGALVAGPRAETRRERYELLREANAMVVAQAVPSSRGPGRAPTPRRWSATSSASATTESAHAS